MKNLRKMQFMSLILCGCFALSALSACGGGSSSESYSESSSNSSEAPNDDKKLSETLFENPSLDDRPMVMMHSASSGLVDDVYNRGYGGIVTNVSWSNDYLQNDRAFSALSSVVKHAVDKGMHVWLYDEYGYPSGTAYGQTLNGNPEYEALGLVPQYKSIPAGASGKIDLLHGHTKIVSAFIYDGKSQLDMNLASGIDVSAMISDDGSSVTYNNRTSGNKVLVAYMSKPWYENTHSMENWYAQQRYINMLDAEPVQKFISLTHEKYYDKLGGYFGNGIQAFFTDEPALQGSYFEISDRPRQVLDEPDPNVPIIECLNYSETLFEKFKAAYGYDLKPLLGYLYNDDGSAKAKQVRMDFYLLTSRLFELNYLGAIEDWCSDKGVKSSGHLLLEETLYQNPWFAGDMLQLLGQMGIPGSDLLYSEPIGAALAACVVSKMAASAAEYTNKTYTFAEISGAFDGTKGDLYDQINAVGVQACMGINTFASYYYQGNNHTAEEDKIFSAALGRMRYMTTGAAHSSKVALYYPYEGVSAETLPSVNMYQPAPEAKAISDSFNLLCRTMVGKQVDYDLVDSVNLAACTVSHEKLVSPAGEEYGAVVIPYTTALRSETLLRLIEAANAGVKIILVGIDKVVCETGKEDVAARFDELYNLAEYVTSENGAANWLRRNGYTYMTLDDEYAENVFMSKRENRNYSVFTVVNGYEEEKTYRFSLETLGNRLRYFDVVTGNIEEISSVEISGGKLDFSFTLPANRTGFFVID